MWIASILSVHGHHDETIFACRAAHAAFSFYMAGTSFDDHPGCEQCLAVSVGSCPSAAVIMPYDPDLSQRLAEMLGERSGFTGKKMFGGICWLLNGHMSVGVYKTWLIVRVGTATAARIFREPHVKPMDISGKPMKGWAMIANEGLTEDHRLRLYVDLAIEFVSSLPAKNH